jgi:hypothetical protein
MTKIPPLKAKDIIKKTINPYLLSYIPKQLKITEEEFLRALYS